MNSILKNWLVNLLSGDATTNKRDYGLLGSISFEFHRPLSVSLQELRQAILEMDKVFPWKDKMASPDKTHSIEYLSEGKFTSPPKDISYPVVTFYIHPPMYMVFQGQIFGYRNYLGKLAEELIKMDMSLSNVTATLEIVTATSFQRVPRKI